MSLEDVIETIDGLKMNGLPLFRIKSLKKCKHCEKVGNDQFFKMQECIDKYEYRHGDTYQQGLLLLAKNKITGNSQSQEEYNPVKTIVTMANAGIITGNGMLCTLVAAEGPAALAASLAAESGGAMAGMSTASILGHACGAMTVGGAMSAAGAVAVPLILDQATKITFCKICNKSVRYAKPCQKFVFGKMDHELL